jgi:hypothetical protein
VIHRSTLEPELRKAREGTGKSIFLVSLSIEVPAGACGEHDRNFKSVALDKIPFHLNMR